MREIVFNSVKKRVCTSGCGHMCVCVCVRHSFTSVQSQLRLVSSLLSTLPRSDSLSCLFFFFNPPFDDEELIAVPGHDTNCGRETESDREEGRMGRGGWGDGGRVQTGRDGWME